MPSPYAWEDDEDQYDPETGSYRPMPRTSGRAVTSFSTPRRFMSESYDQAGGLGEPTPEAPTPLGARLFDPEEGPRDELRFTPVSRPRTALEDLAAHSSTMPQREKPKWWQRLAAGALGGAAGYLNAGGRNHFNVDPAIAGIYAGDYPRQMANWQNQQAGLTTRAKIEAEQADDARKMAAAQSQEALRREQIETQKRIQAREERLANVPPPPVRGVTLSPGGRLVHPVTGAQLADNPPLPPRPTPQIPGRDIPLPPEVEDQRVRMRPPQRGPAAGKVTVTDKKFEIAQAANQAISEHPDLDLAVIKENVMNPRYFTDWEPQKRADVSLEIQRRMDAKKTPKGGGALDKLKAGVEAGTLFGQKGGKQPPASQNAAPPAAPAGKAFPRARLGEYANANNMSVPQAEAALAKLGYTIN